MNDTGNDSAPDNPMGTDGFEFVEYTAPDPEVLGELFEQLGFSAVARHRSKDVILYRHGHVNFIVNREPDSFAQSFARVHGPSACAFAIRVTDAAHAYKRALELGAKPHQGSWWTHWAAWLAPQLGAQVAARVPGKGKLKVIEAAPGSYARIRADGKCDSALLL
jgi:4-hydroxyphenylpyruvate dioxygenase-like putative hemolysin